MAKSAHAFRTIREVADWLGVAAHVLRFWESKFSQIKPVKRAGGRRYYRPSDMELVGGIKVLLHDRGMTIRGVKKLISDEGIDSITVLSPPIDVLLEDADVIDITPDQAWEEDTAAEEVAQPDDTTDASNESHETPVIEAQPEADEPETALKEPTPAPMEEEAADEAPSDPQLVAPTPAPVHAPPAAFAQLETLATLAQSPGALTSHLSALKSLRDRMAKDAPPQ